MTDVKLAVNKEEIFRKRAQLLARPLVVEELSKNFIEVLLFDLGEEKYALETYYIREVYPFKDFTKLPSVAPYVLGIINVRRKIIPLIDLKIFFSISASQRNASENKIIIIEGEKMELALLSDGSLSIQKIPLDGVQTSLPMLTGIRAEFLRAVTTDRIAILDGKKLLAYKEFMMDESTRQRDE